jgi:hypothetical protein
MHETREYNNMAEWLKNIPDTELKKLGRVICIDGVYYDYSSYNELYDLHCKVSIGDVVKTPYNGVIEAIKAIDKRWSDLIYAQHTNFPEASILEITFTTDTGYIIYDIYDCE